ncbi:MAG: hypothetical protein ACI8RZ_000789 [Myxococcota bacterium]|jgi:hypothetical protein
MRPETGTLVPGRLVAIPAGAAVLCELVAWVMLALPGTLSPGWYGSPRLLVAVHLLTLGTLALSIVGFGWQLVPVVTAEAPPEWWSALGTGVSGVLIAGVAILCAGMLWLPGPLAGVGGALVIGGLLVRALLVGAVLIGATGRRASRGWLLGAEVSLLAGIALGGMLLAGRMGHPILDNPITGIGWHAALLLLGWVGGWIGGIAPVLLPMFAVSTPPRPALLATAGVLWFAGLWTGVTGLWAVGAALLVGGLLWSLHGRIQRRLTPGLLTAALGLVGLLLLGGLAGRADGVTLAATGLVLFAMPVLRGVALRIAPFLLWSHQFSTNLADAPPVAALLWTRGAWAAGLLSVLGGAVLLGGLTTEHWSLASLGAGLALVGSTAHAGVMGTALVRTWMINSRRGVLPGMEG